MLDVIVFLDIFVIVYLLTNENCDLHHLRSINIDAHHSFQSRKICCMFDFVLNGKYFISIIKQVDLDVVIPALYSLFKK